MSEPDPRPRPRYGEYATPEQQRASIKAPEKNPHYAPPPVADAAHDAPAGVAPHLGTPSPTDRPVAAVLRHPFDRAVTIALLVLGLYNVITTMIGRGSIAAQIDQAYRSMGLAGDYAVTPLTGTVADVIAIASLVLWVIAAALAGWFIVRGRVAFWIPLVAGVVAGVLSAVGYLILFLHDPAFVAYVQQAG